MTQGLSHRFYESEPDYGVESSDLTFPASTFFDFPLFPQASYNDELAYEPRHHIPQPLDLSRVGNSKFGNIEEDWTSQGSPASYEQSFRADSESGWMHGAYSPNPRLRVQQSTPNTASSPATPPPMNAGGNWATIDWSNVPPQAYLSPTAQNFNSPQQAFRGHKRLSSGSSVASAGPNSPYIQSSVYPHPHIVDSDNLSASSPHLENFDTGLHQPSPYDKPLYYQHPSPLNTVSFVQPFENLNLTNENSFPVMARQSQAAQERQAASTGQRGNEQSSMNRNFTRSDTASSGVNVMGSTPKFERTDTDAYTDSLYTPQDVGRPTPQQQGQVNQAAFAPSNSAVNYHLQQAQATRAQREASRSLTPGTSTDVSRDSPFSAADFAHGSHLSQMHGNYRASQAREEASRAQRGQRGQRGSSKVGHNNSVTHGHGQPSPSPSQSGGGAAINTIKLEDLDSSGPATTHNAKIPSNRTPQAKLANEPSGFAADPSFVSPLQSSVTGITDGNSGRRHNTIQQQAHYAAATSTPSAPHSSGSTARTSHLGSTSNNFFHPQIHPPSTSSATASHLLSQPEPHIAMASQNGASTSGAAYPFIASVRRQSTSMRSEQTESSPTFPPSLPSMESTKSESSREPNVRPPVFTRQDTSVSTQPSQSQQSEAASPRQRPANTSASTGNYPCPEPGCNLRFPDGRRLNDHRRTHRRTSGTSSAARNAATGQANASRQSEDGASPRTPTTNASTPRINPQAEINNQSRNSAPGPHRCQRNNPATGRVCNAVFSRSYDLTRHEDTIHSTNRPRIRCEHCTDEKTFSRTDALTRHMRVVHPDITDTTTTRNRRRG